MAILYRPSEADLTMPAAGGKRCSKCGRVKPVKEFSGRHTWCRMCRRIDAGLSYDTPEGRAKKRAYNRRPEVRERKRAWARQEEIARERLLAAKAYFATERGQIVKRRANAVWRLKRATTDEQRRRAQACIDRHTAALAALDAEGE